MPDTDQTNTTNPAAFAIPAPADNPAPTSSTNPAPADNAGPAPANSTTPNPAPATPTATPANSVPTPNLGSADLPSGDTAPAETTEKNTALIHGIAEKIGAAHNILVALSSDPNVDDLAAAIGLSLYLDKIGKRATAIYSGTTPNALKFLQPAETFDTSTDALQDFVIALDKEKADHLRYKLDGDYVKIYITPYKSRIAEEDLEFKYGDYNVDLVLALDVANGTDLDSALREHGRIMHDAQIVNITTGPAGKFGEIEWSEPRASSVSEMIAALIYDTGGENPLDSEEATAFLTGVIAATDRFSAASTTPDTMKVASELMKSGADQQLITQNIEDATENLLTNTGLRVNNQENDPTALDIEHLEEREEPAEEKPAENSVEKPEENVKPEEVSEAEAAPEAQAAPETPTIIPETPEETPAKPEPDDVLDDTPKLLSDLKATEDALAHAGAETVPEPKMEKVIVPSSDLTEDLSDQNKYGQMLEEALNESNNTPEQPQPIISTPVEPAPNNQFNIPTNPAVSAAPAVENQAVNGVPAINYNSDADILPPPPTPPVDFNSPLPA